MTRSTIRFAGRMAPALLTIAVGAAAQAADLGPYQPRGSIKDAPIAEVVVSRWSGLYGGVNLGYAFSGDDRIGLQPDVGPAATDVAKFEMSGIFGGAQIGYNMQSGSMVVGVEVDFQGSGIEDKVNQNFTHPGLTIPAAPGFPPVVIPPVPVNVTGKSEVTWFGTARGRLGFVTGPMLLYATGGLAFGNIDYTVTATSPAFPGASATMKNDGTELGFAVGGGIEYALSDRWSLKGEYLYVNFRDTNVTGAVVGFAPPPSTVTTIETPDFHSVRAGLNYKF